MINKLFRKYNQNVRTIWTIIFAIAFFVILLQAIFGLIRNSRKTKQEELLNNYYQNNANSNNGNNKVTINDNKNNVNNQNIENVTTDSSAEDVINYFVKLCNSAKIQEAYDMLSKDCKSVLFPTIDYFKTNYYNKIFTQERIAKVEKSIYPGDIYKVTYGNNLLSNGGYNQGSTIQDYIYITKEDENVKISLNKFLYISDINKIKEKDGISVRVIRKKVYTDYEVYQVQIMNNTTEKIYVTPDEKKVYLLDKNNMQYTSNIDELQNGITLIEPKKMITIELMFNKMCGSSREARIINFSEIITNYEEYKNGQPANTISINIDV